MRLSNKHLKIISLIVAVVAVVAFLSSSSSSSNPGVSSEKVIKMDPMTSPSIMTDPEESPWPNCVGMTGEECKAFIEADSPDLKGRVYIIGPHTRKTADRRLDRVRIFVNETGIVESAPGRG